MVPPPSALRRWRCARLWLLQMTPLRMWLCGSSRHLVFRSLWDARKWDCGVACLPALTFGGVTLLLSTVAALSPGGSDVFESSPTLPHVHSIGGGPMAVSWDLTRLSLVFPW